ncbi:hypothetical protein AB1Y20_015290 [Prymnesium parvum]|uniref:Uncharacterized protein n=1 Tax=Prymnesium parvum TaxID=97485 RepID=A0AB34K096_PRYPA|mmetsp:Transcript_44541/g.110892  ORF Transcript_44541/g.110892 Transcript_44541/m.110892 type:complete len:196 (-) Transcript_44541:70-657(-)
MAPGALPASAYDHSTLPDNLRRAGVYSHEWKDVTDRRDPSGYPPPWVRNMARAHELLDDQQVRSATSAQPHGFVSLLGHSDTPPPPAPEPTRYEVVHSDLMPTSTSFEFVRRGQRCGDVGWGCFQADPKNTQPNGRMDGHALVSTDLNKKHQFMHLSGDPGFDKRAGKLFPATFNSLRKPETMEGSGRKTRNTRF